MNEFIEELKYNQNVNIQKNLENKVDLNYVIERLEDIQNDLLKNLYYFSYHNKNLTKTQYNTIENLFISIKGE